MSINKPNMTERSRQTNRQTNHPWLWVPTLYFAEGVPYFLVTAVSIVLFNQLGMPNGKMALFTSIISFPWVIKPLWSPFVDVVKTKRWWVLLMQSLMVLSVLLIAWLAPKGYFTWALILFTITAFASATHDIAADGYYMLALSQKEQAAFVGIRSTFYRIAGVFCQSLLLLCVGTLQKYTTLPKAWMYVLLGCGVLIALIALWHNLFLPNVEPHREASETDRKHILHEAGITFVEFFRKPGIGLALCFMLLYRLPEALLLKLNNPFFLDATGKGGLGLNVDMVGYIYFIGLVLMLLGGILGGLWASRYGIKRVLMPMALCLTLPCIVYVYLSMYQPNSFWIISVCIGIEQLGYGLGYTACMLYMMHFAEGAHRTAHFSFCTAFMFLGLLLPGMVAGYIEEALGYVGFFWVVMACCIPSLVVTQAVKSKL